MPHFSVALSSDAQFSQCPIFHWPLFPFAQFSVGHFFLLPNFPLATFSFCPIFHWPLFPFAQFSVAFFSVAFFLLPFYHQSLNFIHHKTAASKQDQNYLNFSCWLSLGCLCCLQSNHAVMLRTTVKVTVSYFIIIIIIIIVTRPCGFILLNCSYTMTPCARASECLWVDVPSTHISEAKQDHLQQLSQQYLQILEFLFQTLPTTWCHILGQIYRVLKKS